MPRIAPTLYEFVPVNDYLKISEAVLRVFDASDELRKNRMKARIKFLIDRVGIDDFREMVEEELKKPWADKNFDPTPFLYVQNEEEEALARDSSNPSTPSNEDRADFELWRDTNVMPQRQNGYSVVLIKVPQGDINEEIGRASCRERV